jgi:hypothetical protein
MTFGEGIGLGATTSTATGVGGAILEGGEADRAREVARR